MAEIAEKLRANLGKFFDGLNDGILIAGYPDRRFYLANQAMCQMLGYSRKELTALRIDDIHPSKDLARVVEEFQAAAEGQTRWNKDIPVQRKDNSIFYADISVSTMVVEGGTYVVGIFREITERKKAEEAVREREALLHSIFTAVPVGIGLVKNRILQWVNEHITEMTGYSHEELKDKDARILYPDEAEYERVGRVKYARLKEAGIGTIDTRWRKKHGAVIDVRLSSSPLNRDDLSQGVIFTALDITEQKLAEDTLKISEENYRAIFDNAQDTIVIHDIATGKILDANKKANELLGYSQEELKNLMVGDFSQGEPPFTQHRAKELIKKSVEEGPQAFEWRCKTKQQQLIWTEVSLKHIVLEGVDRVMAVVRDISERKEMEEQLKNAAGEWTRTFDAITDSVFIQDNDHTITRVNKALCGLLRQPAEDIAGKKCYELFHQDKKIWPQCPFEKTRLDHKTHTEEVNEPQFGIPLLITTSPIFDDEGKLVGSVHIAKDISQIKNIRKETERRMHDLEVFRKAAVGREMKIIAMKKEIEELKNPPQR